MEFKVEIFQVWFFQVWKTLRMEKFGKVMESVTAKLKN